MLVLGISVAFDQLEGGNQENFFTIIFIVSIILIIEIYTTWSFYKVNNPQISIVKNESYDQITHLIHHILLPLLTYYSSALFIYFNRSREYRWFLYAITFFVFTLLFYNLRGYFERKREEESVSHYVYDIIKLFLFFMISDVLFQSIEGSERLILVPLSSFLLSLVLTILSLSRRQITDHKEFPWILSSSGVIGIFSFLILSANFLDSTQFAFFNLILFYVSMATFHHKIHKSLTFSIFFEYLLIIFFTLTIFLVL